MTERTNQYGGKCVDCGEWVAPGAGYARREDGRWMAAHRPAAWAGECVASATDPPPPPPEPPSEADLQAAREWVAFAQLEGYRPRILSIDELDAALADADIDAMREAVAKGRREILTRFGGGE